MKYCPKCKQDRNVDDFHNSLNRHDGLESICKECKNKLSRDNYNKNKKVKQEIARENYKKRRLSGFKCKRDTTKKYRDIVDECKKKCELCNEDDPRALDFHHIDKKIEGVAKLLTSASLERILDEIKKCIILCSNCHRKYHSKRFCFLHDRPPYFIQLKFRFMFY